MIRRVSAACRGWAANTLHGLRVWICLLSAVAVAAGSALPSAAAPARRATLPAASPDGRHVVYCSERDSSVTELYLLELATGLSRRLTYSAAAEGVPAWADSGRRVAFSVAHGDSLALVSMRPDGSDTRTQVNVRAKSIAGSHSGRRIAYTMGSWTRSRLCVANADGTRANALTDSASAWYNIAWSPDDRFIAATRNDSSGSLQIWIVNTDGSGSRPLVKLAAEDGRPQWPAWSPDGRTLAFQAGTYVRESPEKSDARICTVDMASGRITRLRTHPRPMLDEAPSWLDAGHLVFQSTQSGVFELWVMAIDGTGARKLTE